MGLTAKDGVKELLGKMLPQGAPRGLLVYWVLHRVARSPTYGYEILTEIEEKSEGAWRPGPGSVYPLLRRLVRRGYVEVETLKRERTDQRRYRITKKGAEHLQQSREMFQLMSKRWASLRGIFVDLIEPEWVGSFVIEGSKKQFDLAREILGVNRSKLSPVEVRWMLKEYSLVLERQLRWVNQQLNSIPVVRSQSS